MILPDSKEGYPALRGDSGLDERVLASPVQNRSAIRAREVFDHTHPLLALESWCGSGQDVHTRTARADAQGKVPGGCASRGLSAHDRESVLRLSAPRASSGRLEPATRTADVGSSHTRMR